MRPKVGEQLIGSSSEIRELTDEIQRVSRSDAKVLITGESGVGKEIVARNIHSMGPRATMPFAPVNCAGIPETLLESELFGHVKGSFTGAYRDKPGKLESAHSGTIFLDEVGEMTLRMQGLLLRFLETGELQKVGGDNSVRNVNVRVLAATNRDLKDLVVQGLFRADLYYRLNVIHLHVPALRDRRKDIPLLVQHFVDMFASDQLVRLREFDAEAMDALVRYSWPGNVRELANVVERLAVSCDKPIATIEELPIEIRADQSSNPHWRSLQSPAEALYSRLVDQRESFWSCVYPLFVGREITKQTVRDLVKRGLEDSRGSYKLVAQLFNIDSADYRRFLSFLRNHDCHLPFRSYRTRPDPRTLVRSPTNALRRLH